MKKNLELINYIENSLKKMPTEQALNALYRWYGRQNLLTEEFYDFMIEENIIEPFNP